MYRRVSAVLLLLLFLLAGCRSGPEPEKPRLSVVTTTYPVSLFACAVSQGVDGVAVERLDTGETSCLHDYTLSVSDMKKLSRAGIIAVSGAGLEDFLEDALDTSSAEIIDCSRDVTLLENMEHEHEEEEEEEHDHDHGHWDPHIWMDPSNAAAMVRTLGDAFADLDPENADTYQANAEAAAGRLMEWDGEVREILKDVPADGLITFHDGFQYFCRAYGLPLLAAIEEEAGSEASAREIVEISRLVREHSLPAVFTEVNGSDATARAISRETGCRVAALSMIMDGPEGSLDGYGNALLADAETIAECYGERGGTQ